MYVTLDIYNTHICKNINDESAEKKENNTRISRT